MAIYKLAIGGVVEFEVKFTLNDAGTDKHFGMKLSAQRQPLSEQDREFNEQVKVKEFLAARDLKLLSWLGKSPLVDDKGQAVAPSSEALDALFEDVAGMVALVFASYQVANGAKGRAGN